MTVVRVVSILVVSALLSVVPPAPCAFRRWRPGDPAHGDHLIR